MVSGRGVPPPAKEGEEAPPSLGRRVRGPGGRQGIGNRKRRARAKEIVPRAGDTKGGGFMALGGRDWRARRPPGMRARPAPRARPLSGSRCVHPRQTEIATTPWSGHILLLPERRDDNRRFGFPQARTFAQKGGSQRTPRDRRPLPKASLAPLGGPPPDRTRPFPSPWPLPPVPLSPPPSALLSSPLFKLSV